MSDLTHPLTNPELAQAVADMAAQGSRASREAVLDIVISCLLYTSDAADD